MSMPRPSLALPLVLLAACGPKSSPVPGPEPTGTDRLAYPEAPRGDVVDDLHGTAVPDPYRWLEDVDSETTQAWIDAQNDLSRAWLRDVDARPALVERLTDLWTYARWTTPVRRGDTFVWTYNDGTMDQPLVVTSDRVDDPEPRVLLDPATLSDDGTVAIRQWALSDDGTHLAYGLSDAGTDWRTWRVVDVATGEIADDTVRWSKFSDVSWAPDGSGFFYSRYPEPSDDFEQSLANQSVWFHRLGTDQADDVRVYARPDHPQWGFDARVAGDGAYLVLTIWEGTAEKSRVYYAPYDSLDLSAAGGDAGGEFVALLDDFDANYVLASAEDRTFRFFTNLEAPRGRMIAIDLDQPGREHWTELVPQAASTLRGVQAVGDDLVLSYLDAAQSRLEVWSTAGEKLRDVALPGVGTVGGVSGSSGHDTAFLSFASFTQPTSVYALDADAGTTEATFVPEVDAELDAYVTEQVFYPSKDGTEIPMFLTYRKDLAPDGDRPVLLYGYGGFNIPITPSFKVENLAWLELGGVYASANLRGGGEFGQDWHHAGTLMNKQNVFDDFIAAAEHLVDSGWTRKERIAIHGRSNGGLLVGATLVQRPDLFGAAIPSVGVLDMLRYHQFTIGWAWASDYGRADDSEEMFRYLLAYSPVHNAREAVYPPTLITTAEADDRVVPGHSFKFGAALQAAQRGDAPILMRVETRAGHGAGTPVSMLVDEAADKLAFLVESLGVAVD